MYKEQRYVSSILVNDEVAMLGYRDRNGNCILIE